MSNSIKLLKELKFYVETLLLGLSYLVYYYKLFDVCYYLFNDYCFYFFIKKCICYKYFY